MGALYEITGDLLSWTKSSGFSSESGDHLFTGLLKPRRHVKAPEHWRGYLPTY